MRIAAILVVAVLTGGLIMWFMREKVPARASDYLAYCPTHAAICANEVAQVSLAVMNEYMPGTQYCPPERPDRAREEISVRAWLVAHPEQHDKPTSAALRAALLAIDSCRR